MGASDGQTLNGWVPEKVPQVAEKILGGRKLRADFPKSDFDRQ